MTVSQALEAVSAAYVPGVIAYYAGMKPDPWQRTNDELEDLIKNLNDEMIVTAGCERFVTRCKELIERFKRDHGHADSPSPADAFSMGPERFNAAWSVRKKECVHCQSKEDLSIESFGKEALDVRVVCARCKSNPRQAV